MLINAYQKDTVWSMYTKVQLWSAVMIDDDTLVTNAHVVVDEEQKPTFAYEVCETKRLDREPECFSSAYVIKYNIEEDIAVLKLATSSPTTNSVIFASATPELWETVKVLWYPWYWGETITQTEGKISWFEQGYYKVDANLDSGNSGWGAFNDRGEFVWVPTFISVSYSVLGYIVPFDTVNRILASGWSDGTQIVSGSVDSQFEAFIQKKYAISTVSTVQTPYVTISNAQRLWFTVDDYQTTYKGNWPESITFEDRKWKTTVTFDTMAEYDPNNLWQKQHKQEDMKLYRQLFKTVLTKDIVRNGHTWQVTYADQGADMWWQKIISFRQISGTWGSTVVTIATSDSNLDSFVNWIVLFLKFTEVKQSAYNISDYLDITKDIVDLEWLFPVYTYRIWQSNTPELLFTYGWWSEFDGRLAINKTPYDPEYNDISYLEFADEVSVWLSWLIAQNWWNTTNGQLIKNKNGSVFYALPVLTSGTQEHIWKFYIIYFFIRRDEDMYMYTMALPVHNSPLAQKQSVNLLNTIEIPSTHGFGGYGISENQMGTVQSLLQ